MSSVCIQCVFVGGMFLTALAYDKEDDARPCNVHVRTMCETHFLFGDHGNHANKYAFWAGSYDSAN